MGVPPPPDSHIYNPCKGWKVNSTSGRFRLWWESALTENIKGMEQYHNNMIGCEMGLSPTMDYTTTKTYVLEKLKHG